MTFKERLSFVNQFLKDCDVIDNENADFKASYINYKENDDKLVLYFEEIE